MADDYDEDLLVNPFYKAFNSKAKQLYQTASRNRWLICIPRKGTTSRSHYNLYQFESHVLKPVTDSVSNSFKTVNDKEVDINGSYIVTIKGFSAVKSVHVLFEETFFNENNESYHVLCIDQPLEGSTFSSGSQAVLVNLETLQNCIDFLWENAGSRRGRQKIDEIIDLFNSTYTRLESESVRHTMDAANAVFTRAMQTVLKESYLRRQANLNKAFMDNVKIAVETYVMHGLYKRVFKGISSFLATEDAALNKMTRNLGALQARDLGINKQLCKNIPKAQKVLSNLNKFTTPLEKLYVLKFTIMAMTELSKVKEADESAAITADDLLPALVFLVVKSEIPNWLANLTFLHNFHFSRCKHDEFQFYLSSTEAAVEHVRSGRLDDVMGLSHSQRLKVVNSLFVRSDSYDRTKGPLPVDVFFEHVRSGRTSEALEMLKDSLSTAKEIRESMCHPLCACDKCEKLIASKRTDPNAVTVFSRDDLGSTALHQASEFGSEELIYELIKRGAVVNATNYHGSTPLHYACSRGHHNVAVILAHYDADVNASDNDGNTPLHMAVENGHEMCIEFMLSSDCSGKGPNRVDVNAANENGDTALHIASRWGYVNLVYMLLKHGASVEVHNKSNQTPQHCALNAKVLEVFNARSENDKKEKGYVWVKPGDMPFVQASDELGDPVDWQAQHYDSDSPVTSKRKKEFNRLLKAVADGNEEQVMEGLGLGRIPGEDDDLDGVGIEERLCHPLCVCEACQALQRKSVNESVIVSANMGNKDGVRPLHVAALHGYERIVLLLIKRAGADPNVRTNANFRTPLHLACQYNHIECVSKLLKYGAKPSLKDSSGNTPLHFCCTNGHIGPAILLLQNGANVQSTNQRGNSPLHDAARWNFADLVRLLLYYKAPVTARNKMQLTPLQYARQDDVRELLVQAAEELDSTNPLPIADKHGHDSKADLLPVSTSPTSDEELFQPGVSYTKPELSSKRKATPVEGLAADVGDLSQTGGKSPARGRSYNIFNDTCGSLNLKVSNADSKQSEGRALAEPSRRSTVNDLFLALEVEDIAKLRSLAESVKNFDRRARLRRADTVDKSDPLCNPHLKRLLSIEHFDRSRLRHVDMESLIHKRTIDEDGDAGRSSSTDGPCGLQDFSESRNSDQGHSSSSLSQATAGGSGRSRAYETDSSTECEAYSTGQSKTGCSAEREAPAIGNVADHSERKEALSSVLIEADSSNQSEDDSFIRNEACSSRQSEAVSAILNAAEFCTRTEVRTSTCGDANSSTPGDADSSVLAETPLAIGDELRPYPGTEVEGALRCEADTRTLVEAAPGSYERVRSSSNSANLSGCSCGESMIGRAEPGEGLFVSGVVAAPQALRCSPTLNVLESQSSIVRVGTPLDGLRWRTAEFLDSS